MLQHSDETVRMTILVADRTAKFVRRVDIFGGRRIAAPVIGSGQGTGLEGTGLEGTGLRDWTWAGSIARNQAQNGGRQAGKTSEAAFQAFEEPFKGGTHARINAKPPAADIEPGR